MQENYMKVPENIITGKDLDYLSDMFQWNYGGLKSTNEAIGQVTDQEVVDILTRASNLFEENLKEVLNILSNGGNNNEQ